MYLEIHPHIREIRLYYFEEVWKVAESFRDLSNFSAMEQPAKANQEMRSAPKSAISPAETAMDYLVNRSLKKWLGNRSYVDLDDLMADVKTWIALKDQNFFAFGMRLSSQWDVVLDVDGG
nr:unnamed protein product [Haemonchus contortus]